MSAAFKDTRMMPSDDDLSSIAQNAIDEFDENIEGNVQLAKMPQGHNEHVPDADESKENISVIFNVTKIVERRLR